MAQLPFEQSPDNWGSWYLAPNLKLKCSKDTAIVLDIDEFNSTADILGHIFVVVTVSCKVQNPLGASDIACAMYAVKEILKFNDVNIRENVKFNGFKCAKRYYTHVVNKRNVPNTLRMSIFVRDKFKCVYCGLSAKDGAILNVDHILPISKGGSNESHNLQTLCRTCNNGKADRIMPDDVPSPSGQPA
jgi:5-methylcytosine-specific restriction endonuclease McrA